MILSSVIVNSLAQDCGADAYSHIDTLAYLKNNSILSLDSMSNDTLKKQELYSEDLSITISKEEFKYGDNYRTSFTGILPNRETRIRPTNFAIFAGATLSYMTIQHIIQKNSIWSETGEFRFIEDGNYALYIDKVGHTFGSYFSSYFFTEMFLWSGFDYDLSFVLGPTLGMLYTAYVEVMDGFAAGWGFSPSDFYFNVAGSVFFMLQHYIPFLQNITPKFMYIPANWHGELPRKPHSFFIDDYASHTFYWSFNIHNMLPNSLKDYWPSWLQLTFGVAVRNLCDTNDPAHNCDLSRGQVYENGVLGSPRYIIGLDYDLVKILPDGAPFWNWAKQTLNHFKLPAPAIEFSNEGTRFYLMYPF